MRQPFKDAAGHRRQPFHPRLPAGRSTVMSDDWPHSSAGEIGPAQIEAAEPGDDTCSGKLRTLENRSFGEGDVKTRWNHEAKETGVRQIGIGQSVAAGSTNSRAICSSRVTISRSVPGLPGNRATSSTPAS